MSLRTKASFHLPMALSFGCSVLVAGSALAQSSYVQSYTYNKKGQIQSTTTVQPQTAKDSIVTDKTKTTTTTSTTTDTSKNGATASTSTSSTTATSTASTAKTATTSTTATTTKAPAKPVIVSQSKKDFVSQGPKWQNFSDYIEVKPGQETMPLTLTVNNGTQGTTPYRAIRATLGGKQLFSERDFSGRTLTLDLSGAVTPGSTQIIFTAYGNAGSTFNWQVASTVKANVTGLAKDKASPGDKIKAQGKNLPTDLKAYAIKVDGSAATVNSATSTEVEFTIPEKAKPGKAKPVEIKVSGVKAKALTITIVVKPEIKGLNYVALSGGQTLTISGINFGTDAKDVKVTFNGQAGQISSVTDSSINVITPEFLTSPGTIEVKVSVGGLDADKSAKMMSSMRAIPNDEGYSPFEIPAHLR